MNHVERGAPFGMTVSLGEVSLNNQPVPVLLMQASGWFVRTLPVHRRLDFAPEANGRYGEAAARHRRGGWKAALGRM